MATDYNNPEQTENIVRYEGITTEETEKISHTPNINDEGIVSGSVGFGVHINEIIAIPDAVKLHIKYTYGGGVVSDSTDGNSFGSFWEGSHSNYTPIANYSTGVQNCGGGVVTDGRYYNDNGTGPTTVECDIVGDTVTFGYWTNPGGPSFWNPDYGYYAVVTGYDEDGDIIHLKGYSPFVGEYQNPDYDESEVFLGWSIDPQATSAEYITEYEVTKYLIPTMSSATTLYAVWSPVVSFNYDGNNATAGSMESTSYDGDTPTTVTLAHEDVMIGNNINLYAPNYKKTGYGFAGWSTDQNAWEDLTDDDESNDPVIYGPNQSFTMTKEMALAETDGKTTLYAVWAPAETDTSDNPISLQDWQGCSSLTPTTYSAETGTLTVGKNTITALTDNRDSEVYTIARLADGNCWMTENLRLDNEATISTTNTNNPVTVDGNVAIKNNDGNTSAHLSPNSRSWCTDWDSGCFNQSYLNTFNTNLGGEGVIASYSGSYSDNKAFQWQSYGNNYNWYSATAGNGTYNISSGTVAGDLCPAGWHLPYGGSETGEKGGNTSGGFYYLNQQMGAATGAAGSNNWRSFPNNFVYSGYWNGSSANLRSNSGHYWSSTANDTYYAYYLSFYSGSVSPGTNSYNKYYGYSVRCMTPVE